MKTTNIFYNFTLREQSQFQGTFTAKFIKVKPEDLNGKPIKIATDKIRKICRVEDTAWAPPKLRYFLFELSDDVKISGKPVDRVCLVNTPFGKHCKVEFDNMIEVEKIDHK